jgi:predicted nucleic acid-binding protein
VIPAQLIAEEALGIALNHRITAYDACYVAAAEQLKLPLITADEKLATKLAMGSYEVQWLGDVEVAPK